MTQAFIIIIGKLFSLITQIFNLGSGSTWPGHIALKANKHFVRDVLKNSTMKTILIAGTNGKTTTSKLIQTALTENGKKVLQNNSGANLLNGIASTLLLHATPTGKLNYDFAIFEVDENALPQLLKEITPDYVVLLNLFRDQLDRYGEVNTIINNWKTTLEKLPKETTLVLNADDPQIAYLGKNIKGQVLYFGLLSSQFGNEELQHAADSVYCPKCGEKLTFAAIAFSHLGDWACKKCGLKKPDIASERFTIYPLPGLYNKYNVRASLVLLQQIGLTEEQINEAFTDFTPAFGRQEIIKYKNKNVQVFLSKNPTSFNESYRTIQELGGKTLLLVLNDRVPDGRDVSWIWDVDLPELSNFKQILVAGDRVYDMALRLKYELGIKNYESCVQTYEDLKEAIETSVKNINENETLFILPTYSAMLETRKILIGKQIL